MSMLWALGLPSIKTSLYFHQSPEHHHIREASGNKNKYFCISLLNIF